MKVTKKMIERAANAHFRSETVRSLDKQHALQAVYYKQHGNKKDAKIYSKLVPKSMIDKIEKGNTKRAVKRKSSPSRFGVRIQMPRFRRF